MASITEKDNHSLVKGNFEFKKLIDGNIDKTIAICIHCLGEFKYHRSTSSLKYHLHNRHSFALGSNKSTKSTNTNNSQSKLQQQTLEKFQKKKKYTN